MKTELENAQREADAAPELLKALTRCEELISEAAYAEYLHEDSHPGIWDFLAEIRAAIAKAEGKA